MVLLVSIMINDNAHISILCEPLTTCINISRYPLYHKTFPLCPVQQRTVGQWSPQEEGDNMGLDDDDNKQASNA